jgi:uncharacterized protein YjiS (DUF1127 family)
MMIALEKSLQQADEAQPLNAVQNINARILLWINRYRQRKLLRGLDDFMLQDIGMSRADALRESSKPFWKP